MDNKSLREAIINAFAHNDYLSGDTPVFGIFSDRFEITTYGGLVEGLSKEEFFTGASKPRNREIMRIFKDLEFVERLGSGMPHIVRKYGRNIFKFMTSMIQFAFPFDRSIDKEEGKKLGKKKPQGIKNWEETREETREKIIEILRDNPAITIKGLANLLGLTSKGIEWNLRKLKEQNIIHRIGPKKGGYWEMKALNQNDS